MKLWIDDLRPAPTGYVWLKSVDEAKECIEFAEDKIKELESWCKRYSRYNIELINLDHDAGDYARFGGDYIRLLDWMEATGRSYPIHIHSMNPVGRQNILAICQKNNWRVIN